MADLRVEEIAAGLSVYQNVNMLRQCHGCLTNANKGTIPDRNGPFLVLDRYDEGRWLCVPLYTFKEDKADRIALKADLKTGYAKWIERDSFYSTQQFWAIPDDCLVEASREVEFRNVGARNWYAVAVPEELAAITAHSRDRGTPFIPLSN